MIKNNRLKLFILFSVGRLFCGESVISKLNTIVNLTDADFQSRNILFLDLLHNAQQKPTREETIFEGLCAVTIKGFYLEMGVFAGQTINYIASLKKNDVIYGFDSFEGLPEKWHRDDALQFPKGAFALPGLPAVLSNVKLYKGWFNKSLPLFKASRLKNNPIAFLHIDCDIYSSTKTIFDVLGDNIVSGTIIQFDELYNYAGFERHELKAFVEFLNKKKFTIEFLAYNPYWEQVAVKIVG